MARGIMLPCIGVLRSGIEAARRLQLTSAMHTDRYGTAQSGELREKECGGSRTHLLRERHGRTNIRAVGGSHRNRRGTSPQSRGAFHVLCPLWEESRSRRSFLRRLRKTCRGNCSDLDLEHGGDDLGSCQFSAFQIARIEPASGEALSARRRHFHRDTVDPLRGAPHCGRHDQNRRRICD